MTRSIRPLVAVVPVRALEGAKSRLGAVLDAEERRDLVIRLLDRTVRALTATPGVDHTIVVSPDPEVLAIAETAGARPFRQATEGLNAALHEAHGEANRLGAAALLVLPVDLPLADAGAIADLVSSAETEAAHEPVDGRPLVLLVPDRHGRGTNALLLVPPDAIPFAFGGDSRAAHAALARDAGARYLEAGGPLTLDLDTPDDLLLVEDRLIRVDHAR